MPKTQLLDDGPYEEVRRRIGALTPQSQGQWGKMDVAQMMAHCAEVLEVTNGKELKSTPWFIRMIGPLFKGVITSDKPNPRNSPTHKQYVMTGSTKDFDRERARLLDALAALHAAGPRPVKHPIFGPMTAEEAGWASYKHLDHHLRQFGV